jgi:hypothetical protein
MNLLKQSTAKTLRFGPFLDETDGKTAETGLTISQADVRLSKDGGAFAQKNDATSATHDENGWYSIPLNATDTNTLGQLQVAIHESGALPVFEKFVVVSANVYDSLVGNTDKLQVDVTEIAANAINAAAIASGAISSSKFAAGAINATAIAADAIGASELATDAVNEIRDAILADSTPFNGADVAAILTDTGTTLPATLSTIEGKIDTIDTEVGVIDGIVDDILTDTDTTIPGLINGLNDLSTVVDGTGGNQITASDALAEIHQYCARPASRNVGTGAITYEDADGGDSYTLTPSASARTRS